jgi:hypothetical protein
LQERRFSTASELVKLPVQKVRPEIKEIVRKNTIPSSRSKILVKKLKNENDCDKKQPPKHRSNPCQPCQPIHRPRDKTPGLKKQPPICPDQPPPIAPKRPSCKICSDVNKVFPKIVFTQNSIIPYISETSNFTGFEQFIDKPKLEHRQVYESTPVWKTSEGLQYLLQQMRMMNSSFIEKSEQKNIKMRDAMVLVKEIKQKMDWAFAGVSNKVQLKQPTQHRNSKMYELTLLQTNAIFKQPHQKPTHKMMELMAFSRRAEMIRPQLRNRKLLFSNNNIRLISGNSRPLPEHMNKKSRLLQEREYEVANEKLQQKFDQSSLHRLAGCRLKATKKQRKMVDK